MIANLHREQLTGKFIRTSPLEVNLYRTERLSFGRLWVDAITSNVVVNDLPIKLEAKLLLNKINSSVLVNSFAAAKDFELTKIVSNVVVNDTDISLALGQLTLDAISSSIVVNEVDIEDVVITVEPTSISNTVVYDVVLSGIEKSITLAGITSSVVVNNVDVSNDLSTLTLDTISSSVIVNNVSVEDVEITVEPELIDNSVVYDVVLTKAGTTLLDGLVDAWDLTTNGNASYGGYDLGYGGSGDLPVHTDGWAVLSGQYYRLASYPREVGENGEITFEFWIQPQSGTHSGRMRIQGVNLQLAMDSDEGTRLIATNPAASAPNKKLTGLGAYFNSTISTSPVHVVLTIDSNYIVRFYLNASLVYTGSAWDIPSGSVLSDTTFGQNTNGKIRYIRVYNRPLSLEEITESYNGGVGISYQTLAS